MSGRIERPDVLIIGAGPAGTCAAALVARAGFVPLVLEKEQFPRFVIGESLLPHCMDFFAEAGLLEEVEAQAYQIKDGAAFFRGAAHETFEFRDQHTRGWDHTHNVVRADFDARLANAVARRGVDVRYQHTVTAVESSSGGRARIHAQDAARAPLTIEPRFVLDASGYGRVLPRLLELDRPAGLAARTAIFSHFADPRRSQAAATKIWICIHPKFADVWYWVIPFSNARASVGVVGPTERIDQVGEDVATILSQRIGDEAQLRERFAGGAPLFPPRRISAYATAVSRLYGDGFALLGNAGEFLDPIFSSGITIALKSASLAVATLTRELHNERPDWEREFAQPLLSGVNTFRTYVEAWYDGSFQRVIFQPEKHVTIKRMICSVLAGYVWDAENPFVNEHARRLRALVEICERKT